MITAKSKGFTLIEIMLALLIFAIIALIVTIGLSDIIKAYNRDAADAKRLEQLQIAMAVMQLDFQQIISREIVNGRGDRLTALISQDNYIEFTRAGFPNPLSTLPYSNLERVGYQYKNQTLARLSWPVLDRAPDTQPIQKVLLTQVNSMQIRYLDNKQQFFSSWPPANLSSTQSSTSLPVAIEITLELQKWGTIKRLWNIPGMGFAQT